MPTWPEITQSVYGAWRLARFDPDGMNYFDLSVRGFWRSFGAAIVVLPVFIYFVAIGFDGTDASAVWFVVVKAMGYAAAWAAFPIAMIGLAQVLGLTANYVPFIIALNWASVLQNVLFIPANTLAALNDLTTDAGAVLFLVTLVLVLIYQGFVTPTALQTTAFTSAGLVLVSVLLQELVGLAFDQLV